MFHLTTLIAFALLSVSTAQYPDHVFSDTAILGDFERVITVSNDNCAAAAGIGALLDPNWDRTVDLGVAGRAQLAEFKEESEQWFLDTYGYNLRDDSPDVVILPGGIKQYYQNGTMVGMYALCSSGTRPRLLSTGQSTFGKKILDDTAHNNRGGRWIQFEIETLFAYTSNGTVASGPRAGHRYSPNNILFTNLVVQVNADKDWNKPQNREEITMFSAKPSLNVINHMGLTEYIITADAWDSRGNKGTFIEVSTSYPFNNGVGVCTEGRIVMTWETI